MPSKRPFWTGSGAPGQEAENGCQGQICSNLNYAEMPSKRPFWKGSGAPGQEAENDRQGQICSKCFKLSRNPVEKVILENLARRLKMGARARSAANCSNYSEIPSKRPFWRGPRAPGQEARQDQICSKWLKLDRNPVEKAILERFWGTWPAGHLGLP